MYEDGGCSGGTLERPGLQKLLADVASARIDILVVYKIDRLTRSLTDFAKLNDPVVMQQWLRAHPRKWPTCPPHAMHGHRSFDLVTRSG